MKTEKTVIPFSEIDDTAREIAVAWVDNYTPYGSVMPEIAQKQKLASDIIHYHRDKSAGLLEWIVKDKWRWSYKREGWMRDHLPGEVVTLTHAELIALYNETKP